MANTYFKVLNRKTAMQFNEDIIASIRDELSFSTRNTREDIFEVIKNLENSDDIDMNFLLKCYAINKLLKNSESTINTKKNTDINFTNTANPNYKKSLKDNLYYRYTENGVLEIDKKVSFIHKDGSYETVEQHISSKYKIKKLYNIDDVEVVMQLIDVNGHPVTKKLHAVSLLNLRKEYVQKYKYAGFSGNSNDILATIKNAFCSPVETGYYMDKHFHLYKWNEDSKSFIRNTQIEMQSPLLTDYEFANGQKVVKKEYIGI